MADDFNIKKIAEIRNGFSDKFGIPRQSGLCDKVISKIVFEEKYRTAEAVRGLEDFSHIWLIWHFSRSVREEWSPTVRPPRLGGNKRIGVFATRSPFRPNPLGLSCVKLEGIEIDKELGPIITVSGADLLDGTPIYDIKPYIPYADAKPDAASGFVGTNERIRLNVRFEKELNIESSIKEALIQILSEDPRPAYQNDPDRVYRLDFDGYTVSFKVNDTELTVTDIKEKK
ncbi:MAG: tRNA (N6-threonylcarbamoyladenosine(37)-N6)-methyltransferase TrmO [Clostridia bacterium]|nr:tRNA (N6-threonylcarbamoyladenosine(37)-N6)-methyltransferase TrmO [Clostridia bacterium]